MEKHRCKLCCKNFSNGRALGGHMRSHLSTLPLPPLGDRTESDSSSTRSGHEDGSTKLGFYELRENPKKSCKRRAIVEEDGESDAESTQYPTRRRSKRAKKAGFEPKKCKWAGPESPAESTQLSSVSDPASQDEEVALCLMMLSRDAWVVVEKSVESPTTAAELKKTGSSSTRPSSGRVAKFKCLGCNKVFRTSRALDGHKASNKQCCQENTPHVVGHSKIFECPFCYKVFGSGQALGGHKRSHLVLLASSSTNNNNNNNVVVSDNMTNTNTKTSSSNGDKVGDSSACFILDLNLPPPVEIDDDFVP
ncbi:hypothetical protein RND81_06G228600 [Saponaria officinalis]|uniref:C2H2-type domain-containing protein n=1 Tax=Saponaria officinalis TaxID=3572 RepID=A0AAW1KES9_SAPOF